MEITPEMQASIDRFRDAIEKAQLKLDSVPPDLRERFQQEYDNFRKRISDSEIMKMVIMADALTPREPLHWWERPPIYFVPDGDGWKKADSDQKQRPKPAEWKKDD